MKAVQSLIAEHLIILRVAAALSAYAHRLRANRADCKDLARFAAVFVDFAEGIHREKEESILLPLLARHGLSWDDGVLALIRSDHERETSLIGVLRQAGERAGAWTEEDRHRITVAALALVEFQANHHMLESAKLFPKLSRLDAPALAELERGLLEFDCRHERLRTEALIIAQVLIDRYAPKSRAALPEPALLGRSSHIDERETSECYSGLHDP